MMRIQLRQRLDAAGVVGALGGPLPAGRRVQVMCVAGQRIISDCSARWRGRTWCTETPARLTPTQRRQVLAATTAVLADHDGAAIELVLATTGPVVIGVAAALTTIPADDQIQLTAVVRATAPYVGLMTGCVAPPGATIAPGIAVGTTLNCAVGDVLATLQVSAGSLAAVYASLARQLRALSLGAVLHDGGELLHQLPRLRRGLHHQRELEDADCRPNSLEVLHPGMQAMVQAWPGRLGRWDVGVPPSGPFDDRSFRLANRCVGNDEGRPGIEFALAGPVLRATRGAVVCIAGAPRQPTVDGRPVPMWTPVVMAPGAVLACGAPTACGCRGYVAVRGGIQVDQYLGSAATFDLGGFGGFAGRPLAAGDHLPLVQTAVQRLPPGLRPIAQSRRPVFTRTWEVAVREGPHAAPDFLTPAGMQELYATAWTVHHNSNRTGVRLRGPVPKFARSDGGEAGLHPSNIHDNAYAIGAIDLTGDMPILLGPDGPSCGGFVCPAVTLPTERWKLGQLRPGDTVRFRLVAAPGRRAATAVGEAIIARHNDWTLRRSGDDYLLIEVGPPRLDLELRLRIHTLQQQLLTAALPAVIDLTPGVRSLQLHFDPQQTTLAQVVRRVVVILKLAEAEADAAPIANRTVHLPLSWDDPSTQKAIAIYMRSVNPDAPWCPSNLEFIRRINGLDSIATVKELVFTAEYLVLGLGDVYLGAPVATPLDPRHRLVTTKYNPARTWTPENAVGIGGAYLCVYGMEGPGGYQFIGRTVPVWNTWRTSAAFQPGTPWLLRHFDVLRWYEVSAEELLDLRARCRAGTWSPRIEPGSFSPVDYRRFLRINAPSITAFTRLQRAAFAAERGRWAQRKAQTQP